MGQNKIISMRLSLSLRAKEQGARAEEQGARAEERGASAKERGASLQRYVT